jgi:hypothetical protein
VKVEFWGLMRFLPKGLNPFKIQTIFNVDFVSEFYNSKSEIYNSKNDQKIWKMGPKNPGIFLTVFIPSYAQQRCSSSTSSSS